MIGKDEMRYTEEGGKKRSEKEQVLIVRKIWIEREDKGEEQNWKVLNKSEEANDLRWCRKACQKIKIRMEKRMREREKERKNRERVRKVERESEKER